MRIVLIGSGNVASVLGRKMVNADHEIIQVYSRNANHASSLAEELKTTHTSDQAKIQMEADIYILAVSDHALPETSEWLRLGKKLVVHTAGSVSKNVLTPVSKNFGVLYPLQSLRKEMDKIPEIPLLIDGNTDDNITLIHDFAASISSYTQNASDQQRELLHIAAVFVSNFTNHLYTMASDFCRNESLDFKLLLPLIKEVANRISEHSPQEVQTGPAVRNDDITINKHLSLLEKYPSMKELYRDFSNNITQYYSGSK
jgi:predicted short-subunit dehydrogenase-like oxidoreductase (DUF2520 family)